MLSSLRTGSFLRDGIRLTLLAQLLLGWQVCGTTKPQPLTVPVDTKWLGYDGNWSPVTIRVGTPPQWVYVLPNTISQETWVISPGGCDGSFACENKRGGLFAANESKTWNNLGFYELGFDVDLGISQVADYGFDSIALSEDVAVPSQIIALQNSTEFWTGNLGLGIIPSNFTEQETPTFLSSLVQNVSVVPSHSYGYTTGAYYRLKGVPASLTFGGVDTNRFVPNDATFALGPGYQPIVAVNSITVSATPSASNALGPTWQNNPLTLLSATDSALFTIDSSTPFLWLPEDVCDMFAKALNLTYSDDLQLYLFSNSTNSGDTTAAKKHIDDLTDLNVTFSFTISDQPAQTGEAFGDNMVTLNLPLAAFSLDLSYPFPLLSNTTVSSTPSLPYFPLRRAANSSQYTIGRSFLQETYLAVDYERGNFSLSQATFSTNALSDINLVEITRPSNSNFTGPISPSSSGLSTGAKAGIGAGAGVLAIFIALVAILLVRRRNIKKEQQRQAAQKNSSASSATSSLPSPRPSFLRRLLGSGHGSTSSRSTAATSFAKEKEPAELLASSAHPSEIPCDNSNTRYELPPTNAVPIEMPGEPVSMAYYSNNSNATELSVPYHQRGRGRSNSTDKAALADQVNGVNTANANPDTNFNPNSAAHIRHSSHLPAYEPPIRFSHSGSGGGTVTVTNSDGVSPSTPVFNPTHVSNGTSDPVSSASASASASDRNRHSSSNGTSASLLFSPLSKTFPPPPPPAPGRRSSRGSSSSSGGGGGSASRSPSRSRSGGRRNGPTAATAPVPVGGGGGGGGLLHLTLSSAQQQQLMVQRSESRNSRFREEGIHIRDVNEDLYGQYPLTARRYSWEEED